MSNQTPKTGATPPSRKARREAARRDRRLAEARTASAKPAWQSPMALLTMGAVAVGLVIVVLASGVLSGRGNASTDELLIPIRPTPTELVDPTNARAVGPADAPVTVEVWSDFQCPACGFWSRQVEPDLVDEYVAEGSVRLVYRDFAFLDGGDRGGESQQSGAAARCAGDQGSFWPYHDYLYENQDGENEGAFRRERLDQIAEAVGLDMDAFGACMSDGAALDAVAGETGEGRQAGVASTPQLVVNGVFQRAGALPMEDTSSGPGLRTLIDAELAKASPSPAP